MSTFIPGQWDSKRLLHKPSPEFRRLHSIADYYESPLVPYFDTPDRCSQCDKPYRITSHNGIAMQACGCGIQPVPVRQARDVPVLRNQLTSVNLLRLHREVTTPKSVCAWTRCAKPFVSTHDNTMYCSRKCYAASMRSLKKNRDVRIFTCATCKKPFPSKRPSYTPKFCTVRCKNRHAIEQSREHWKNKVIP